MLKQEMALDTGVATMSNFGNIWSPDDFIVLLSPWYVSSLVHFDLILNINPNRFL
jgi:hypothetical protein